MNGRSGIPGTEVFTDMNKNITVRIDKLGHDETTIKN
jgi:hypothetical protein